MTQDEDRKRQLLNFPSYNDYLTSFVTSEDRRFIGAHRIMHQFVEFGYRSEFKPYTEPEFQKHRKYLEESQYKIRSSIVFSQYLTNKKDEFLNALKERELPNAQKILSTIIFLSCRKANGSEVLGYIDFEFSSRCASQGLEGAVNWKGIYEGRVKLTPRPTDLSYQNTFRHQVLCNDSDNYAVIYNYGNGLQFKHKGDHKIIAIGPKSSQYDENVQRTVYYTNNYGYVVLYDHIVRKKN